MPKLISNLIQDLSFAVRQLRKSPSFAFLAVLTLSLGIGAATAVFSVVDAALLRPLPYAHQERLVSPYMVSRTGGSTPSSYIGYQQERAQVTTFEAFAGWSAFTNLNLEAPSGPVSLRTVKSSDNFFTVFGIKPLLGRTYLPGEDQPGKDDVTVLSFEVWQTHFGGDPDVIGRVVRLDGSPYTVIGVMPPGFRFPLGLRNAIYTPFHTKEAWRKAPGMHWMQTIGLLKPGVTLPQAQADLNNVLANMARTYPTQEGGHTAQLTLLADRVSSIGDGKKLSGPLGTLGNMALVVRIQGDPTTLTASLREAFRDTDPTIPFNAVPMTQIVSDVLTFDRMEGWLFGLFAAFALLLSVIGLYGLVNHEVELRTREIGIRMTLGSTRSRVVGQVLQRVAFLLGAGIAAGWILTLSLRKVMASVVVLHPGHDLALLSALTLGLAILGLLATLIPARRAAATEPMQALRAE